MADAVDHGEVIFIAVGTPSQENGFADLQHVLAVAGQVGRHLKNFKVVVNKSTVPVGTAYRVHGAIATELRKRGINEDLFEVISNPEFLKEGAAIDDFMRPDRIVIGLDKGPHYEVVQKKMDQLYASFNRHHARTLWNVCAQRRVNQVSCGLQRTPRNSLRFSRAQGQEMCWFQHGSTILVFVPTGLQLTSSIETGARIQMEQALFEKL